MQTAIAQAPLMPQIRIETYYLADDEGSNAEVLQFINDGGALRGAPVPSFQQTSFLEIERHQAKPSGEQGVTVKHFPWYYFGPVKTTGNATGVLIAFEAVHCEGDSPRYLLGEAAYPRGISSSERRKGSGDFGGFRISQSESLRKLIEGMNASSGDGSSYNARACVFFRMAYHDFFGKEYNRLILWAPRTGWEYPRLNINQFEELDPGSYYPLRELLNSVGPPSTVLPPAGQLVEYFDRLPSLSDFLRTEADSPAVYCTDLLRNA